MLKRWTVSRHPTSLPPRGSPELEVGSYIAATDGEEKYIGARDQDAPAELAAPEAVPRDPEVEEHQALVMHHPGFRSEVERLRGNSSSERLAAAAARWQISYGAITSFVNAADESAVLEMSDDLVFVESRPTVYLIQIPRPLTARRRAAITEWLKQERTDMKLRGDGDWASDQKFVPAKERTKTLPLFERWNAGERLSAIADDQDLAEQVLRDRLREIYARMKRLSTAELRTPPP